MTRALSTLAVALAIAGVVACAAGRPAPATSPNPPLPPLADVRDQITALDQQLTGERDQLGLAAPTLEELAPAHEMSIASLEVCTPGGSQTCTDVCTLSGSICDNATKICDLATQLPGDVWAAERCDSGKATCAQAARRCCDCVM